MIKYQGYHKDEALPFQPGEMVLIPKGTPFGSTHPSKKSGVTKRAMKIKINHLLPGAELPEFEYNYAKRHGRYHDQELPVIEREFYGRMEKRYVLSNPSVRWAGTGGYWFEVDINLVQKVEG